MDILNLKNNLKLFLVCSLFISCINNENKNYVLKNQLPIISIRNSSEKEIILAKIILRRNSTNIDTGNLTIYSKSEKTIDVELFLNNKDTIFRTDTIIVYIKNKSFIVSEIEKKGVVSSGRPFVVSYKINNNKFVDREGFYLLK